MIKALEIGEKTLEVNSAQGWLFCYKEQFGHDILPDLIPILDAVLKVLADIYDEDEEAELGNILNESTVNKVIASVSMLEATTVINVLWAMAKNAGNKTPHYEFVNEFDPFPYEQIAPQLFVLIVKSSFASKNSESLLKKIPALSTLIQSSSPEQNED